MIFLPKKKRIYKIKNEQNLANLKNSSNTFEVTDNRVAIVIKSSFVVLASESK